MAEKVNLPASSKKELEKIIKAYGHIGKEADLQALSNLTGIGRTSISPNNPFLVDVNIISKGQKKKITELGSRLSRALDHNHAQDIAVCYTEIVRGNDFLSNLISTIRIKGGMSEEDAAAHALYASGQKNTKANRTGANAVVDILVASSLLNLNDGKLVVAKSDGHAERTDQETPLASLKKEAQETTNPVSDPAPSAIVPVAPARAVATAQTGGIPISINIELHLPATSDPEVYRELFKALKENLLSDSKDG